MLECVCPVARHVHGRRLDSEMLALRLVIAHIAFLCSFNFVDLASRNEICLLLF